MGRRFPATLLIGFVLALMNLEQTFRASVGTMRWRVKYVVLGLGVIFGAYIVVRIQAILYPTFDPALAEIESRGLLVGSVFLVIAYTHNGLGGFDVHPSRAVLRSSITVLLVGGCLCSSESTILYSPGHRDPSHHFCEADVNDVRLRCTRVGGYSHEHARGEAGSTKIARPLEE